MPRARKSHRDKPMGHLDGRLPDNEPEIRFEEYLLRRAARASADSERQVTEAVSLALSSGLSWNRIGQLLGMPTHEAQAKYSCTATHAS
jgi:hypothetical protein